MNNLRLVLVSCCAPCSCGAIYELKKLCDGVSPCRAPALAAGVGRASDRGVGSLNHLYPTHPPAVTKQCTADPRRKGRGKSVATDSTQISDFIVLFFNPNIYPESEYQKRLAEQVRYCEQMGVKYHVGHYDHDAWLADVHGLENEPERGKRCSQCFKHRFRYAQKFALENGYNAIASVLGVSRHKDQGQVDEAGIGISTKESGIRYMPIAWDKNQQSAILNQQSFYRQNYCGCEFSMRK